MLTTGLMIGESYNDRKAHLMDQIAHSRQVIKEFRLTRDKWPDIDISSVIVTEQRSIIEYLKELKEINRWRAKMKLDVNQRWEPPRTDTAPPPVDLSALWKKDTHGK